VKICVAAVEVEELRKKERQDETQFTTKIGKGKDRMKLSLPPKLITFLGHSELTSNHQCTVKDG
jgi:hypothetical protein